MSTPLRWSSIVLALALLLPRGSAAQTVTELYATPDSLRLEAGQRQGLSVQAFDDAGNAVLAIRFRSTDTLVARVASNGTVSALAGGRARIVIEAGSRSKTIQVVVTGPVAAPVARSGARVAPAPTAPSAPAEPAPAPIPPAPLYTQLTAEPATLALLPTEHGRLQLRALRADGTVGAPEGAVWRSSRPEIVALSDSMGGLTAMASGQAVVEAAIPNGPSVRVPVAVSLATIGADRDRLVLSPDDSDTVSIIVPAQGGRRLRPQDLVWSASDDGVLEVRADGVVRARTAGRSEVVVRGFLQEVRVPVIVHQRVARFAVAPRLTDTVRIPAETSREFTVIPQTIDSLPIEGVPMTWTVGDTTIARFDPVTGTLTARRAGRTTLEFSARGFLPKGWSIEVLPGAIALDRQRLTLAAGERTRLTAAFVDLAGAPVGAAQGVQWVTSNAGLVKVDADGTIEAVAPGRASITARAGAGAPSSATVLVTGDLLLTSTRSGRLGIYATLTRAPEQFIPLVADSFGNYLDGAYSPDRSRVAYASDRLGAGNYDIYVADADGRNPARLTTEAGMDLQPHWTPDGQSLVFVSLRGGARQLYVMQADGSNVRALTALPGGAEEPAISPDGRTVAFTGSTSREAPGDIYVVPLAGGVPQPVTATRDRRENRPLYLPSGDLAWVLHRKDRREPELVLQQGAAGGPPVTLVSTDLTLMDIALARDGARIAWVASKPADKNRVVPEFTLQWRALPGGVDTSVRLLPGERITSPAF